MSENHPNARANERSNVFLSAALYTPTRSYPVRIRNISVDGALVDGANLPDQGSAVSLRRAHLAVDGEIAWRAGELRGVHFSSTIDVDEWVRLKGHAGQQRVDQVIAAIRTPECEPKFMGDAPNVGVGWESVESISTALEQICERLSNSPSLTAEIAEEVLRLDSIVHALRQLARSKAKLG
jgi:hypothetical protein